MSDTQFEFSKLFLACMCKRYLEVPGTKILILTGNELVGRIGRRIGDSDLPIIFQFLSESPKVVAANLAYNIITDKGMDHIASLLEGNSSLVELNLMNNNIQKAGIKRLTKVKHSGLKSLRLNGNKIGPKGLKYLAAMVSSHPALINLDIGECDSNIETFIHFMAILRTPKQTLQALNLSRILGPFFHTLQTDHVANILQQTLAINSTLTELHLQKIGFRDHDVEIMVEGLKKNSTILLLDLGCNNIGDFGIECLAEYLGTKPPLRSLFVSSNIIQDTGARALSFKFPFSNLVFLDLSNNNITERGVLDILNTLKKERPVEGLFIRNNEISDTVCKVLFRMILSGVLNKSTLDVSVYQNNDTLGFTHTEDADHLKPHYYCLCAQDKIYCRYCTVTQIKNKM